MGLVRYYASHRVVPTFVKRMPLHLYARDRQGHRAALRVPVVVANASSFPAGLTRNWVTHHVGAGVDFADG